MSGSQFYSRPAYGSIATWVPAGNGLVLPTGAVAGGYDITRETIYVGRAIHEGELLPGKVVPSHARCYVPWRNRETVHTDYQALVVAPGCELLWLYTTGDRIPAGAVQGGVTNDGEPLYIGRHEYQQSLVVGKVQPSLGVLYIPFGGNEVKFSSYEILCIKCVPLL